MYEPSTPMPRERSTRAFRCPKRSRSPGPIDVRARARTSQSRRAYANISYTRANVYHKRPGEMRKSAMERYGRAIRLPSRYYALFAFSISSSHLARQREGESGSERRRNIVRLGKGRGPGRKTEEEREREEDGDRDSAGYKKREELRGKVRGKRERRDGHV